MTSAPMIINGTFGRSGLRCQDMVDTTKLGVELEAEVGKNLEENQNSDIMVEEYVHYLHVHLAIRFEEIPLDAALGGDPELEVTHLLHSVIHMASLERQDYNHHLQLCLGNLKLLNEFGKVSLNPLLLAMQVHHVICPRFYLESNLENDPLN